MKRIRTSDSEKKPWATTSLRIGAVLALLLMWPLQAHARPADDLYLAAGMGNINEVRKLLNQGVNPNAAVDKDGITALMQAARIGDIDVVTLLLTKGANVNARAGAMGTTALMNAAAFGEVEMVRLLIDKGADIHTQNTEGLTALSQAKVSKKGDIVNLLKTHGAKDKSEEQSSFANPVVANVPSSSAAMPAERSNKVLKGKVLHIEGNDYFVKTMENGEEVRLHIDKTTQTDALGVRAGDYVSANIDDQNHVISILTDQKASSMPRDKNETR